MRALSLSLSKTLWKNVFIHKNITIKKRPSGRRSRRVKSSQENERDKSFEKRATFFFPLFSFFFISIYFFVVNLFPLYSLLTLGRGGSQVVCQFVDPPLLPPDKWRKTHINATQHTHTVQERVNDSRSLLRISSLDESQNKSLKQPQGAFLMIFFLFFLFFIWRGASKVSKDRKHSSIFVR